MEDAVSINFAFIEAKKLLFGTGRYIEATESMYAGGIPGVLTLFRFKVRTIDKYEEESVWLICGDVPAWIKNASDLPTSLDAIRLFTSEMDNRSRELLHSSNEEGVNYKDSWSSISDPENYREQLSLRVNMLYHMIVPLFEGCPDPRGMKRQFDWSLTGNETEDVREMVQDAEEAVRRFLVDSGHLSEATTVTYVGGLVQLVMVWKVVGSQLDDSKSANYWVVFSEIAYTFHSEKDCSTAVEAYEMHKHIIWRSIHQVTNKNLTENKDLLYSAYHQARITINSDAALIFAARLYYFDPMVPARLTN